MQRIIPGDLAAPVYGRAAQLLGTAEHGTIRELTSSLRGLGEHLHKHVNETGDGLPDVAGIVDDAHQRTIDRLKTELRRGV